MTTQEELKQNWPTDYYGYGLMLVSHSSVSNPVARQQNLPSLLTTLDCSKKVRLNNHGTRLVKPIHADDAIAAIHVSYDTIDPFGLISFMLQLCELELGMCVRLDWPIWYGVRLIIKSSTSLRDKVLCC